MIQFVLSKAGTKAYTVEQLFEALSATKLKATLGVEKEQMHIKLTVPKGMKQMVWLHEVQEFVKALREIRYQEQLQQKR
jgi:transcription-repair coupling factor (superfamily II helicase)